MKLHQFDLEKKEQKRIPSIGRCIYCGDDQCVLTDEHVIPFALAHNTVIFEKASCIACQKIIQPYEQRILRGQLGVFRARIDAPTRNKKDRPTHTSLRFCEVDDEGTFVRDLGQREIPIEDAPLSFSVWDLPPPRILEEETNDVWHVGRPWTYVQHDVAKKLAREVAKENGSQHVAVKVDEINRDDFLRFLVKTAHAYAMSELGSAAFHPLTTDLILQRSNDLARLVGGDLGQNPHESHPANTTELVVGKITNGPVEGYTAVRIRLYPLLGTPAHIVIVGAPIGSAPRDSQQFVSGSQ